MKAIIFVYSGWLFRQKFLVLPADRRSENNFWRLRRANPDPTPISRNPRISENPRPPTPRNVRNARFTRPAEMPDHPRFTRIPRPNFPCSADRIPIRPEIPRFTRFCRSEIATLTQSRMKMFEFYTDTKEIRKYSGKFSGCNWVFSIRIVALLIFNRITFM